MVIHLGGVDCSGKSTLCKKLSEILNCEITHFDKPKDLEDGKRQYFSFQNSINVNKDIICDRYHDGEYIYAPLYRGYEADYLKEFETELRKMPYLFINTFASLSTIINRAKSRGEDFVKEEDFNNVLKLYDRYVMKQSMPYIRINTNESNIDLYLKRILKSIDIIKKLYDFNVKNNCKTIYYGNIEANTIIVTTQQNLHNVKLKIKDDYNNYWITTNEDNEFIKYQTDLLCPNKVLYLGGIENENI